MRAIKRACLVMMMLVGCGGESSPFTRVDPGAGSNVIWADVWVAGPNDVWAIGNASVYRFDGTTWSKQTPPGPRGFTAVWGASANAVWAVGDRKVAFWNGSTWTEQTAPDTGGSLASIHGASATDVWAVGDNGASIHWDGASWTRRGIAGAFTEHVWAAGPNAAWCAGPTDFKRWNGSSWTDIRDTADNYRPEGVWGFSDSDVWAVGDDEDMLHWNGTAWTRVHFSDDSENFYDAWGATPNDIWAVGERGAIRRWNGSSWKSVPSGTDKYLAAVWGTADGDVSIVGTDVVLHLPR